MVTCETPGLITMQRNARLGRLKTMLVARGIATVKPDELFLDKICNFALNIVIFRKGCSVATAEPLWGQVLTPPSEEQDLPPTAAVEEARIVLDDIDLNDAPDYFHQQIKDMLAKHGKMCDGALDVIHSKEHAIVTPTGTVPIWPQPYRTGPFQRAIIVDQIDKMLKLKVIKKNSKRLG